MSAFLSFRFAVLALVLPASLVAADEAIKPAQTTILFNGRDLAGWIGATRDGPPPADCWRAVRGRADRI